MRLITQRTILTLGVLSAWWMPADEAWGIHNSLVIHYGVNSMMIYRTFLSCANTVEFLRARREWERDHPPAQLRQMQQIARRERDNALAASPIYARSQWLDPALRLDGRFHPAQDMIREKIAWLDRFLSEKASKNSPEKSR